MQLRRGWHSLKVLPWPFFITLNTLLLKNYVRGSSGFLDWRVRRFFLTPLFSVKALSLDKNTLNEFFTAQTKSSSIIFERFWASNSMDISFFVNYHYGFIGIMPMDNTVLFNGGFRILKGYTPFTDYWLVTGPLLDYLNAFFFKSWSISSSAMILL